MGGLEKRATIPNMKPILLAILDGFGYSPVTRGNAIFSAKKPHLDELDQWWPTATLQASGIAVGLPWNEQGNSEVGHLTIGSGRIIWQHFPRINSSIQDGSFATNHSFIEAAQWAKKYQATVHLVGLISSGTVHSSLEHVRSLITLFEGENVESIRLHAVTDGRDAGPHEGGRILALLQKEFQTKPHTKIATLIGRSFALDRDNYWDRTEKAYRLFTEGKGVAITDPVAYLAEAYQKGLADDVIEPAVVKGQDGTPVGLVKEKDVVIMFDFREDSERQLARAFSLPNFKEFPRKQMDLFVVTMTAFEDGLPVKVVFPPLKVEHCLASVLAQAGKRQLHISETGKYAHVTYFFDGLREEPFQGEEHVLVPSEREVGLEKAPEMRALDMVRTIQKRFNEFDFIVVNFANADQVGHTGNFDATVKAVETVDQAIGKLMAEVKEKGGMLLITADHGNAEVKFDVLSGERRTEHTTNPVPFYIFGEGWQLPQPRTADELTDIRYQSAGVLTDVAPTILELASLPQPQEMQGKSLLPYLQRQIR